ncbi:MAG TPA: hypothetical protein VFO61_03250 [Alphaproteobacteria bacterium]|nr:hypothetical protein [Alphaproteobacteria bacterium]
MPVIYVARSQSLQKWGAEVGLTKHLFKLGAADGKAQDALKALNDSACAGERDWKLLGHESVESADEDSAIERLGAREKLVDPNLYPRLRGERGIVKVKPENVANHLMVKKALAGEEDIAIKLRPADIAGYLIANAR